MITADGHVAAAEWVREVLEPLSIPVHPAPLPASTVAAPCALILTPEATGQTRLGACSWTFSCRVVVISSSPSGSDLLPLADEAMRLLTEAGLGTTTEAATHSIPNAPAAIPAVLIRGE